MNNIRVETINDQSIKEYTGKEPEAIKPVISMSESQRLKEPIEL